MREMKDSGIEWIGEIPKEWLLNKTKYIFKVVNGATPKSDNPLYWDGDIPWITPAEMAESIHEIAVSKRLITDEGLHSCGTTLVPKGSIIVSNRAPIGQICIAGVDLCTNQGCKALVQKKECNQEFFYYYFLIQTDALNMLGRGTTFLELSTFDLMNFLLPTTNYAEQTRIANFLDAKCAHIDRIIEQQQAVIEKLKKYKQSVITEAVTKGLNPDVPMKDSGIEWIGMIPEHWEVCRVKNIAKLITDGAHIAPDTDNGQHYFISVVDYKDDDKLDFSNCLKTSDETYDYMVKTGCRPINGDVLVSKDGSIGKSLVVNFDEDFVVASSFVIIRPNDHMDSYYLNYMLKSKVVQEQLSFYLKGTGLKRVSVTNNSKVFITLPEFQVQIKIAEYLTRKCLMINNLVISKQNIITKLTEYKKSLIYEAVTGKLEV